MVLECHDPSMPPPGDHDYARSLSPNGAPNARARAGDRARILVAPRLEPIARRAERQGRGRRPVARAQRGGGAVHAVERALGPDRVAAAAHALGLCRVEPAAGVGSIGEKHHAGRRQVRGDWHSWRGHAARRPLAGDVEDGTSLPGRDVNRFIEVARQPTGGRA